MRVEETMNFIEKQLKQDSIEFDQEAKGDLDLNHARITSKITQLNQSQNKSPSILRSYGFKWVTALSTAAALVVIVNLNMQTQPTTKPQNISISVESDKFTPLVVAARLDTALLSHLQKEKQALSKDIESIKKLFVL